MIIDTTIFPIVESMLPKWPEIVPEETAEIAQDISMFVSDEIQCMDAFLRVPYLIILKIFNILSIIVFRKPFHALSDEKKNSYLSMWSNSRFSPQRDFAKLIQNLTILAFYDHSIVKKKLDKT